MNRIESAAAGTALNPLDVVAQVAPVGCADVLNAAAVAALAAGKAGVRKVVDAVVREGTHTVRGAGHDAGRWFVAAPTGGVVDAASLSATELAGLVTDSRLA